MSSWVKRAGALLVLSGVIVACSTVTSSPQASGPDDGGLTSEQLVADLAGKSPEEREQHLLGLAQEAGSISLYADAQLDDPDRSRPGRER